MSLRRLYIFLLIAVICTQACKEVGDGLPDHPGYLEHATHGKVFNAADSFFVHRIIDSAYNALPQKSVNDRFAKYNYYIGFWYYQGRNFRHALLYVDSLLLLVQPRKDDPLFKDRYKQALFRKGDVLLSLNRYEDAFLWYYQARELVLQGNDTCAFTDHTNRLAMVSFKQRKFAEAIVYYKEAYGELQHCSKDSFQRFTDTQACFDNIGIAFGRMYMSDSAAFYFTKALNYISENEKSFPAHAAFISMARGVIYGNLGDAEMQLGKDKHAEELLLEGIQINEKIVPEDAAYSMVKLIKLYINEGRTIEAGKMLAYLESIQANFPNSELTSRYLQLRSRYAMITGHTEEAYRFLATESRLRDSLDAVFNAEPSADARRSFEQIGNQYRLETANQKKTEYLSLAAVFFITILIVLFIQWKSYQRTRKNISALRILNQNILNKNEHLLTTLEALEKSRRDKHHLLHVVAHDLRGPVSSMAAIAKMVNKGQFEQERVNEAMNMIAKSGASALELINDLLHVRSSEMKPAPEILDLAELLRYCVDVLQHKAGEKHQTILLEPVTAYLKADREKLLRVFHNLLDNAIKFSHPDSSISVTMHLTETKVQVAIADTGIGIPPNLKNTIFYQPAAASRKGTGGEASFGLGLSIVFQLVKEHHGRIWYTSEEGVGTTFYLEIPLEKM